MRSDPGFYARTFAPRRRGFLGATPTLPSSIPSLPSVPAVPGVPALPSVSSLLPAPTGTCLMTGGGSAAAAFNAQDQSVRCALLNAAPAGTQNIGAAVDLAVTLASGQPPTEAEVLTAMTGIATLAGGPAAGAMMGAASLAIEGVQSAVQAIFQALGWGPNYAATYNYCGLQRTIDPKPWGPQDPNWIHLQTMQEWGAVQGLAWGPNPVTLPGGRPPYSSNAILPFDSAMYQVIPGLIRATTMTPAQQWQFDNGSWQNGVFLPSTQAPSASDLNPPTHPGLYKPLPPFDLYVATLLLKNLEFWANCQPFINPQFLLAAAAQAWNSVHQGSASTTTCTAAGQQQPPNTVCYGASSSLGSWPNNNLAWDPWNASLISEILGPGGDSTNNSQQAPPIAVNTGPLTASGQASQSSAAAQGGANLASSISTGGGSAPTKATSGTAASASSSGSTALLVIGGLAVVAVGGTYFYGRSHGMTFKQTAQAAWTGVKRPFTRGKKRRRG